MEKRKILIVEDEPDLARVLASRLISHGFEVVIAIDAYHGFLSAINEHPDLILLDLMLPVGGGLSVIKNTRSNPKIMNIPIIIITGMQDPDYERHIMERDVQAYFQKPYDFDILLKKIKELLNME